MKILSAPFILLCCLHLAAQDAPKPRISPFFDRIDDGPAFFVECQNTTGGDVSSGARAWTSRIRIDGAILPDEPTMGPGLTTPVAPEQLWRGIVALRQSDRSFYPAVKFGALVRRTRNLALAEGKHTIAIECNDVWSDDFEFYWESETQP